MLGKVLANPCCLVIPLNDLVLTITEYQGEPFLYYSRLGVDMVILKYREKTLKIEVESIAIEYSVL